MLLRQGSNLNFSDPESDVLPITPRSKLEAANIKNFCKIIQSASVKNDRDVAFNVPTTIRLSFWFLYCIIHRQLRPHRFIRVVARCKTESGESLCRPEFEKHPVIWSCYLLNRNIEAGNVNLNEINIPYEW